MPQVIKMKEKTFKISAVFKTTVKEITKVCQWVSPQEQSYIFVSLADFVALFSQQKVTFSTCLLLSYCYSEHERCRRCLGCFAL